MPAPRVLVLTPAERAELERLAACAPRPYMRERCAALLKIADGGSVRAVAHQGLNRWRRPETVAAWLDRYLAAGVAGLAQRPRKARGYPP